MNKWNIGLSSWIIQDGNYDDFSRQEQKKFAVEFYSKNLVKSEKKEKQSVYLGNAKYKINGEVLFFNEAKYRNIVVIDFGICAYAQNSMKIPEGIAKGSWIEGEVHLGVDPFFYFESLVKLKDMPQISYDWIIDKIELDTTPRILDETSKLPGKCWIRDDSKFSVKEIEKTDAWKDDDFSAEYFLTCVKI